MIGTKTFVKPGDTVMIECPHSEVCIHMGVAGRAMLAEFRQTVYSDWTAQSAQLYDPTNAQPFSSPILLGEAGFYRDGDQVYAYVLTADDCVKHNIPTGRAPKTERQNEIPPNE